VPLDPARISDNLDRVRTRITSACRRAGRDVSSVTLVAVTKTVALDEVRILASLGVRDLGENRVEELVRKATALNDKGQGDKGTKGQGVKDDRGDAHGPASVVPLPPCPFAPLPLCVWHMIGHLQRNKARKLLPHSTIVHSLESADLAAELSKRAVAAGLTVDVLIEVNVAGEEQKYGVSPRDAPRLAEIVVQTPALNLRGLMTMAPIVDDPESIRPIFARLRELSHELSKDLPPASMRDLSMGMTQDFEVAVEEGATLVRVGSALFA
jgi:uncharacterized pyridoxal phosphate-containing UPF0001 family protein